MKMLDLFSGIGGFNIVPQVAAEIFTAIKAMTDGQEE